MLLHYFLTALRNLRRHWIAGLVNLFCLALGIACLVTTYAVSVFLGHGDEHFANAGRIQVLTADFRNRHMNDTRVLDVPQVGPVVASFLRTDFPQLEAVARRTAESRRSVKVDSREFGVAVSFIDPEFHDVYRLPFQAGYDDKLLRSSRGAVITQEEAQRLFGSTAVVGRHVTIEKQEVTIAAVIDAIPEPTHMEFGLLASMDVRDALLAARGIQVLPAGDLGAWWRPDNTLYTYALLPADGSLTSAGFQSALREFSARHVPAVEGLSLEFGTAPASSIGMALIDSQFALYTGTGASASSLGYFMSSIVLLIACLNYANLAAALAATRAREIGIRRVMGARRSQLFFQHLFEASLVGCAAFALVICLLLLLTPIVARIGPDLPSLFMLRREFLVFACCVLVGETVLAGSYPAFILTSTQPTQALRGGAPHNRSRLMPRLLVGAQFMSVGFLVTLVFVAQEQNGAILTMARTLSGEPVVTFTKSMRDLDLDYEALRLRLLSARHVRAVTASAAPPLSFVSTNEGIGRTLQRGTAVTVTSRNLVSYDFFSTLGIKLTAGREFSRDYADDTASGVTAQPQRVVIDEQLAERLGWQRAGDAVDQLVYVPAAYNRPARALRIIGIVERRPLAVIGIGAASSIYLLDTARSTYATVRLSSGDTQAGIAEIDAIWKQFAPGDSGRKTVLADAFEDIYEHLLQVTTIMLVGPALFAALISAIGLFGMAIHVTDRRRHEIGVRKTLGARSTQIVVMLLKDLSRPIVIGNLLAWPLAWFVANLYRSMFVDRIPFSIVPFVASLVLAVALAWAVVAGRAIRTARLKPATVLRYE